MSGFKDMVQADIKGVFLNLDEFAELHTVVYDGVTYEGIPMVMSDKGTERPALLHWWDRIQGLILSRQLFTLPRVIWGSSAREGYEDT